ncbi:hypothetical protein GGR52DRAFT_573758 [Hypoxylon sp. FL1284]|nr:hypothetical protein GGR52DRAFT_573758 [Hypoxylon sp. FL1284]
MAPLKKSEPASKRLGLTRPIGERARDERTPILRTPSKSRTTYQTPPNGVSKRTKTGTGSRLRPISQNKSPLSKWYNQESRRLATTATGGMDDQDLAQHSPNPNPNTAVNEAYRRMIANLNSRGVVSQESLWRTKLGEPPKMTFKEEQCHQPQPQHEREGMTRVDGSDVEMDDADEVDLVPTPAPMGANPSSSPSEPRDCSTEELVEAIKRWKPFEV